MVFCSTNLQCGHYRLFKMPVIYACNWSLISLSLPRFGNGNAFRFFLLSNKRVSKNNLYRSVNKENSKKKNTKPGSDPDPGSEKEKTLPLSLLIIGKRFLVLKMR